MATVELYVKVEVNSEEEIERLNQAHYSGMLSDMISMWVKYGGIMPMFGAITQATQAVQTVAPIQSADTTTTLSDKQSGTPRESKNHTPKKDSEIKLQLVATEVGTLPKEALEPEPEPPKPKGLGGFGRMRRV